MSSRTEIDVRVAQLFDELNSRYGGDQNDYYGLLFMESVLRISRDQSINQTAFGGNDLGFDGFFFDRDEATFRLFQFKNTSAVAQLRGSLERLIRDGVPALFETSRIVRDTQPIVDSIRRALQAHRDDIDRIFVDFVFRGDPQDAERSEALLALKEQFEERSWLIEQYFGKPLPFELRYLPFTSIPIHPGRDSFTLHIEAASGTDGPDGTRLLIGFVRLHELYQIYETLGRRFLERNIRFALPPDSYVNRSLQRALRETLIERMRDPRTFAFNHNGVTLSVQKAEQKGEEWLLRVPRLLNGAQTVTTFRDFVQRIGGQTLEKSAGDALRNLRVLCKIVVEARPDLITAITINNNRQNPVEPWLLHANDPIQLELADHLKEIGVYYQRQANAFSQMALQDRDDEGVTDTKPIELVKLAKTFLVTDGNLTRLTHLREVFEEEKPYSEVFGPHRLRADPRLMIMSYKIQFRLGVLARSISEKGRTKYEFVTRTREIIWALTCQALLNDPKLEALCTRFGQSLSMPGEFVDILSQYASARVQPLLRELIDDAKYVAKVEEGNFSFLRTSGAFEHAMMVARRRFQWAHKRLA